MKASLRSIWVILFYLCVMALASRPGFAIVTHPNETTITNIPAGDIVGRWGLGSCVVINPNYVLTVRHLAGDIGTTVTVAGTDYIVAQIAYIGITDLRVTRITTPAGSPANLSDTITLNNDSSESSKNTLALAGFGKSRGAILYDGGQPYGYLWTGSNTTLRWGSNKINGTSSISGTYPSTVIYGFFNAPGVRAYEAMPALYDSGGGWFLKDGNTWKVAGILRGIEHSGQALYDDPDYPAYSGDQPEDYFDAVRVYSYRTQIADVYDTPKIISGYVTDGDGNSLQDVIIASSSVAGFTKTNADGYYELWVPSGWSGTTAPNKDNLTFNPSSRSYSNVTSDQSNENYDALRISISGHVLDGIGPVIDVLVTADSNGGSAVTDANGFYDLSVLKDWSGTVTPSKGSLVFDPNSRSYSNVITNQTNEDYDALRVSISGHVFYGTNPVVDVLIAADSNGDSAVTDANGFYDLSILQGYSGNVTPAKVGYAFTPNSINYNNLILDVLNADYDINDIISDDFNDNTQGAMWRKFTDDSTSIQLNEVNQRLGFMATGIGGDNEAIYASNGWRFDAAKDFSLKIDIHHMPFTWRNSRLFLRISTDYDTWNYVSFEAGSDFNTPYWRTQQVVDGNVISSESLARALSDGTLYMWYDSGSDSLGFDTADYNGPSSFTPINGLLQGQWAGQSLYVHIGGASDDVAFFPFLVQLDNFKINSGSLIDYPPPTDIDEDGFIDWPDVKMLSDEWLMTGELLDSDITDNNKVDFEDFAEFAEVW